ncbi:two-component sensor histidine kinase [Paraburkholderia ginsengiterrae]|uniref:histidine kinase n=1 Tax=Paraburkholderia ginsengiterrae TaxID=1462993 RepID=A0A1A9N1H1_9BURK|nr:ATP-binding protein [Paraburkholderia ginsengiterrae]OAJ53014.1 two-component sensor histidine kinase [Paraburkholderia ginsengiterrae]OAJ55710.1 two-component sensor histidine kinase [Paraburkholderia ginsengiterrae]
MPHPAEQKQLNPYRYCRWRWQRFRRAWTDTRADRVPSWSRLYLRAYTRLLTLTVLVLAAALTTLSLTPGATPSLWQTLATPRALLPIAIVTLTLPAITAYRWMRPVWLDLVMVRERAIDFTGGRFNTRARESHSVIIGPLARTLNALAERMERLIAAQRELTNGISHELRTPLARVRFALESLREPASAAEYHSALASIDQDVTELDELIDMSLTYARLEYSSLQSNLESTSIAAWFDSQITDATLLYADKQIVPHVDIDPSLRVTMDKRLMSYAMRNLLRNASRYARSTIMVGLSIRHGNVEIYVEDDGAGVPPEQRERIFDAFVRLDRQTGGYGLGLAITQQVLRAHRGRIAVTDPVTLGGARFEVSWPAGTA